MKKKILTLLLACILCLGLVACSSSQPAYVPPVSDSSDDADVDNKKTEKPDKDADEEADDENTGKEKKDKDKKNNFVSAPGDIVDLDNINYQKIDDEIKANKVDCDVDLSVPASDITLTGYTLAQKTVGDDIIYYVYLFFDYSNNLDSERCFYNGSIDIYQNGVNLSNSQFEGDGFTYIKKGASVDFIIRAELRDLTTDVDLEIMQYSENYQSEQNSEYSLKIN